MVENLYFVSNSFYLVFNSVYWYILWIRVEKYYKTGVKLMFFYMYSYVSKMRKFSCKWSRIEEFIQSYSVKRPAQHRQTRSINESRWDINSEQSEHSWKIYEANYVRLIYNLYILETYSQTLKNRYRYYYFL